MAGIEPASERLSPRISTSVVTCCFHWKSPKGQTKLPISQLDPKVLFRSAYGKLTGTLTLLRPLYHRSEGGVGGRDPLRDQAGTRC
jgi:hypothetical protein